MSYKKGQVITQGLLIELIKSVEYHRFQGTDTIACCVTLVNDFRVMGKADCIPTTEFDPKLGMHYAMEDAMSKVAEFAGFLASEIISGGKATAFIEKPLNALKESVNG